ncbi:(2Fe-2S)-binding protein [Nocardiopsis sp. EMB25]|nr:(2Fe-2S)-binding protein [Nocardiopsis sp. EMB25]
MAHVRVRPVLAEVGRINMLFRLEREAPGPRWRALDGSGASERVIAAEVDRVRAQLAAMSGQGPEDVEWRVAASILHQGLATRLLSPVLAAGLCHGVLLDAARFHHDPGREGPVVLRTDQEYAETAPVGELADWVEETVVAGVMGRIAHVLPKVGRVAPGLLRGNTAAALAGSVRALGADRPSVRPAAEELARTLLARPPLSGTGGYTGTDAEGLAVFRRTTCCLYYRLPGYGMCGDCALRP